MRVAEIMKKPLYIRSSEYVDVAAKRMSGKRIGSLVVKDGSKIAGIMTERDILNKVVAENKNPKKTKIVDIMSSSLITVESDATIEHANMIMNKKKVRRLLVTHKGKIVGIITLRDISAKVDQMVRKLLIESYSK